MQFIFSQSSILSIPLKQTKKYKKNRSNVKLLRNSERAYYESKLSGFTKTPSRFDKEVNETSDKT